MYQDIVIVSAVRTPFGRYCGSLKEYDYFDLGALPMKEVLARANIPGDQVDEVFWGVGDTSVCKDVYTSVAARQTLLKAGLPAETPSISFDKACVSAMSAVHYGCRAMVAGEIECAIGGGATSFSQEPLIVRGLRWKGFRIGDVKMDLEYIKQTNLDDVGWIQFNRPEKMNAVNPDVLRELETAIIHCEENEQVRSVVLTGNEKAFVAGADIDHMAKASIGDAYRLTDLTMRVQERLADLPKPTIAAISGYALGAGCEIALCCDFRIAADNAILGLPEITLGIIPGGGGTQRLTRLIKPSAAARMILLGETVKSPEALSIGLVDKVVALGELENEANSLSSKLARMPGLAVWAAKTAMGRGLSTSLKEDLQIEQSLFCMLFGTRDQKEGMAAFIEKRKPVYKGE